jgi:hypothetical protein
MSGLLGVADVELDIVDPEDRKGVVLRARVIYHGSASSL